MRNGYENFRSIERKTRMSRIQNKIFGEVTQNPKVYTRFRTEMIITVSSHEMNGKNMDTKKAN